MTEDEPIPVPHRQATRQEEWWIDHGMEAIRATVPALNDVLSKLLVVSAGVVGGGLALLDKAVMPTGAKVAFLILATAALSAALSGLYPVGRRVNALDPEDVRVFEEEAVRRKADALFVGGWLLAGAFFVGTVGVALNPAPPTPPPTAKAAP